MIRKSLLTMAAGVFLTALLSAAPAAMAACQGYCADRMMKNGCALSYAGCEMSYDEHDNLVNVDCFYVGAGCEIE